MIQCKSVLKNALMLSSLCCSLVAVADDTDIFFAPVSAPNVLIIFDNSDSMIDNPAVDANGISTGRTRLQEAQLGFEAVLNSLSGVNVGVMIFGRQGAISYPMVYLDTTTRAAMIQSIYALDTRGGTPIVGSLYEAQQYFAGKPVYWGLDRGNRSKWRVSHPDSYTTGADHVLPNNCSLNDFSSDACRPEKISSTPTPYYKSPITSDCQSNHIILFTDGKPDHTNTQQNAYRSQVHKDVNQLVGSTQCKNDAGDEDEDCGRTLVEWMANNPVHASFNQSKIFTHTVAFNLTSDKNEDAEAANKFLEDLANKGKGSFNRAETATDVATVITNIFNNISTKTSSFAPTSVSINQFNRLSHRNDLYFSVFKPSATARWSGNLKRYELGGDPLTIRDQSGNPIIDPNTGNFSDNSRSFWSPSTDGGEVTLGGAASKLPLPANRKLYTHLAGASSPSKDLTQPVNHIDAANINITTSMLTANNATERSDLLNWIRGTDVLDQNADGSKSDPRQHMGDPLHSAPITVTYGGTEATPDISIFLGTNEGFLHAFDSATGVEQFAFMPESLLKNIKPQMANSSSQPHVFGMDGSPVVWRKDVDGDQQIRRNQNDFVYVYSGMRRGGRDYYALDVTERANPKLLWQIQGGSGDFQALGQTWSKPVKTKIKLNNVIKEVLVFAGGFDPVVDSHPTEYVEASMGNAIYIVDALTGQRLWMAGKTNTATDGLVLPDMKYAIPSNLEVIDNDHDGLMDHFYVGDLGGQIWRFDLYHKATTAKDLLKGGRIAVLGENSDRNSRQFFFKPDVSYIAINGAVHTTLAIGSGSLEHPLDQKVHNHFYLLYLTRIDEFPDYENLRPLRWQDLENRSDNLNYATIGHRTNWSGLYISVEDLGEKVLAPSLTFNQRVIFTTYTPPSTGNACSVGNGTARYYVINLGNGNPVSDMDGDGDIDKLDRFQLLQTTSIPTQAQLPIPDGIKPRTIIGGEVPDLDLGTINNWIRSYWYKPE
jgi:type IV pilus assembly protein PilY1